jgi:transposase-like protein
VTRLGITGSLLKTVESTNPVESMTEIVRDHSRRSCASDFVIEIRRFSTQFWEASGADPGGLSSARQAQPDAAQAPAVDAGAEVGSVPGVTTGELTQADAARKWGVDVSVVIKLRKLAKDASLAAFAASKPGRSLDPRDAALEELRRDNDRLSDALKELVIELALVRGKPRWG